MKHIFNSALKLIGIAALVFANGCSDLDDNLKVAQPLVNSADVITKDSELYNQIEKVTNAEGGSVLDEIVCIDFIYPLQLLIYNQNLQAIGSQIIVGDAQFSSFLDTFPAQQSLSISYPISTTLQNGDVFTVNSNTELKFAIDSCSREDIINFYNNLFCNASAAEITPCVWKVKYTADGDNEYVSGTLFVNTDGTMVFNYNETDYLGSWTFLFFNDELHLNINLEGTSTVAQHWNMDRLVSLVGNTIVIHNTPKNTILVQECAVGGDYHIGDLGPSDGIVFYDKGSYSNGWRYMEVAPDDLGFLEWGCSGSSIANAQHTAIGRGLYNTAAIVNFHDQLNKYYTNPAICNSLNNGTVVAKKTLTLQSGSMNGWFLPSAAELNLIYTNLHLQGLGNFTASSYWTSTEIDAAHAQTIDFATGAMETKSKKPAVGSVKARAVRYF